MSTIPCILVNPEFPPEVSGVVDYTAILSQRPVEVSDGAMELVLVHAGNVAADTIESDFPVVDLSGQCSMAVLAGITNKLTSETKGVPAF